MLARGQQSICAIASAIRCLFDLTSGAARRSTSSVTTDEMCSDNFPVQAEMRSGTGDDLHPLIAKPLIKQQFLGGSFR